MEAHEPGRSLEVLALAALDGSDIHLRPYDVRYFADLAWQQFPDFTSDHLAQLSAFHAYSRAKLRTTPESPEGVGLNMRQGRTYWQPDRPWNLFYLPPSDVDIDDEEFVDRFNDPFYFPSREDLRIIEEVPDFHRDNPGMTSRINDARLAYPLRDDNKGGESPSDDISSNDNSSDTSSSSDENRSKPGEREDRSSEDDEEPSPEDDQDKYDEEDRQPRSLTYGVTSSRARGRSTIFWQYQRDRSWAQGRNSYLDPLGSPNQRRSV
ncbi:hypothetical protein NW762_009646 [Fusarium torreyae]|uniref:Uncharacterized protein n=1 Tax=Fusarium torreyae TaxID=1237075 RepID=A0A9W8RSQ5_9HYPO|nr:hypothetical protein NW762_009646 [Fusarium torreyae]